MPEGVVAGAVIMGAAAAALPMLGRVVGKKPGDVLIAMVRMPAAYFCCLYVAVDAGVRAYRAERIRINEEGA